MVLSIALRFRRVPLRGYPTLLTRTAKRYKRWRELHQPIAVATSRYRSGHACLRYCLPTLRAHATVRQPRQNIPAPLAAAGSGQPPTVPPASCRNCSTGERDWPEWDPDLTSLRSYLIKSSPPFHRRLSRHAVPLPLKPQRPALRGAHSRPVRIPSPQI